MMLDNNKTDENKIVSKPAVGVSACLAGQRVRYDGDMKTDFFVSNFLERYVLVIPVCPEVECGMPVPRPAMHLEELNDSVRMVTNSSATDKSDQMYNWVDRKVTNLRTDQLCGFILKSKSPSCGLDHVKIKRSGVWERNGRGIFAGAIQQEFPAIPTVDEVRLGNPEVRKNFIIRLFTYWEVNTGALSGFYCSAGFS